MGPLLIVEDEIAVRDTLTELLGTDGREIVTASDGQGSSRAPDGSSAAVFNLARLDDARMNGCEFLERKSADPTIGDISIIVLSGSGRPAGAVHQLCKPVDVERLSALVDQYC